MIPSKRKVSTGLFKFVLAKGRSYHTENVSLRVFVMGSEASRFSVVVSKRLEKSAVKRNEMKRRVYGLLQTVLPSIKPGSAGVFFLKKKVTEESLPSLSREINFTLKSAGIIA